MKKLIVNTELSTTDYMQMVLDIADSFFDNDGKYAPPLGKIAAMSLFFAKCVTGGTLKEKYGSKELSIDDLNEIISDKAFKKAFNKSVNVEKLKLDFGNAYWDAVDIAETKKTSVGTIIDMIQKLVESFTEQADMISSDEKLDKLSEIAKVMDEAIQKDKSFSNAIIQDYKKSKNMAESNQDNKQE